jgi:hypothetical protein
MTDELSPRARQIVGAAREADGPTEADKRRVRAAVFAAIAAGTAAGSATAEAAAESAATSGATGGSVGVTAAMPTSLKVLAVAASAVVIGVGGYILTRSDDPPADRPKPSVAVTSPEPEPPAPDPVEPTPQPGVDEPAPTSEPELEMEFEPDHIKAPSRKPSTIEAERQLLVQARTMRRSGDARAALAILDDYTRKFSGGILVEERSALRVLVLCDLGNTARATAAAKKFVARWPSSVQASRLRSSCAGADL